MLTPTQKSLEFYRKQLYTCQVVEHFNSFARKRIDLFGFIDIVAIKEGETGVLGIQTTSKNNMNARILKIKREPIAKVWLLAGNKILVDGWERDVVGRFQRSSYEVTMENISINEK